MTLERLVTIMRRLRDPVTGCEWDRQQSFATIAPFTIEEAYEVADAIERRDMAALAEVRDGKIVREWSYWDQLSLLAQLDITEQPGLFLSPEGF